MSSSVARRALLVRAPDERAQAQEGGVRVSPRGGKKQMCVVYMYMGGFLSTATGCGDRSYYGTCIAAGTPAERVRCWSVSTPQDMKPPLQLYEVCH